MKCWFIAVTNCAHASARSLSLYILAALVFALGDISANAQTSPALVRHAPVLNGKIDGSVQQLTGESVTFNSGGAVAGDLFVPGVPTIQLNGSPIFGGTLTGSGSASPTNHRVTLNSGARLGKLRTRTDPVPLPTVVAPPTPTGTRNVSLNTSAQSPGNFATLRNLTLNSNVGAVVVPAGVYGDFVANSGSGLTLGVAGATVPAAYAFQHLTLNSNSQLKVVGPVTITVAHAVTFNSAGGTSEHPEWLTLQISSGGLTLNSSVNFYGSVIAPTGTVTINSNSQLIGRLASDRLTLNSGSLLRLVNQSPVVALASPANNALFIAPASTVLQATASVANGTISKIEFFNGALKLGEVTSSPYQFDWADVNSGVYTLTAVATDDHGVTATSAPITIVVDAPPTVSLTSPLAGAVFGAPASFVLEATAADADSSIGKVEFFSDSTKLGEATTAPYHYQWVGVPAGSYSVTAIATDNLGATRTSSPVGIIVDALPTGTLFAPVNGALASPATMPITASATDSDGTVAKVEFYRGNVLAGTVTSPSEVGTSNYVFTESALPPGTYIYRARVYDNSGGFTDLASVTVTVLAGIPYLADFESSEGYALGAIDGQVGWSAQGVALITGDDFFSGAQSVSLPPATPPGKIVQTFAPVAGENITFADFYAKPIADTDINAATTFAVGSAYFAFSLKGSGQGVLHAFMGDGQGSGQWTATQFVMPLGQNNQVQNKIRLTTRLDFTNKTWDLYADGTMVAADVGFRDNSSTSLGLFALQGHTAGATFFDSLLAVADNPLFADINDNGIDDEWEVAHGLSLNTNNRHASPSGNGVTVIQAYLYGTDPNDFYNNKTPTLTIVAGNNQSAQPGWFNAQALSVLVKDPAGVAILANAPITFSVIQGGGLLAEGKTGAAVPVVSIIVSSGPDGIAQIFYRQPGTASTVSQIRATAGTAQVIFQTTSADGNYYSGQTPSITSLLESDGSVSSDGALSVLMRDAEGRPLINAPVVFTAQQGGHLLAVTAGGSGFNSVEVHTDQQGLARAYIVSTP